MFSERYTSTVKLAREAEAGYLVAALLQHVLDEGILYFLKLGQ